MRYVQHDIHLKKPKLEYIGPDLDTISYTISFKAENGVNPREEMNKLIKLQRDGTVVSVMLGKGTMGVDRWVITDLSNAFEAIDNMGRVLEITTNIGFKEYIR